MEIILKLNNHQKYTVSVTFTKTNAEKPLLSEIFISEIVFRFSAEYSRFPDLVAIYI